MTLSQRAELNTLREKYRAELKPAGNEEELAVEQVARAAWAIRLLERQEVDIFAGCPNPFVNAPARRALMGISTLQTHYERTLHAALRFFLSTSSQAKRARQKKPAAVSRGKRTR